MTVSTIVIVFTVVICSCTIVIVVNFNYRPALTYMHTIQLQISVVKNFHDSHHFTLRVNFHDECSQIPLLVPTTLISSLTG